MTNQFESEKRNGAQSATVINYELKQDKNGYNTFYFVAAGRCRTPRTFYRTALLNPLTAQVMAIATSNALHTYNRHVGVFVYSLCTDKDGRDCYVKDFTMDMPQGVDLDEVLYSLPKHIRYNPETWEA